MLAFSSQADLVDLLAPAATARCAPGSASRSRPCRPADGSRPTCSSPRARGRISLADHRRGSARTPGGCDSSTARSHPVAAAPAGRPRTSPDAGARAGSASTHSALGLASSSSSCRSTRSTLSRVATRPCPATARRLADPPVEVGGQLLPARHQRPALGRMLHRLQVRQVQQRHLGTVARIDRPLVDGALARGDLVCRSRPAAPRGSPDRRCPAPRPRWRRTRAGQRLQPLRSRRRWPRGWDRACGRRSGGRPASVASIGSPSRRFSQYSSARARRTGLAEPGLVVGGRGGRHGGRSPHLTPAAPAAAGSVSDQDAARRRPARRPRAAGPATRGPGGWPAAAPAPPA